MCGAFRATPSHNDFGGPNLKLRTKLILDRGFDRTEIYIADARALIAHHMMVCGIVGIDSG